MLDVDAVNEFHEFDLGCLTILGFPFTNFMRRSLSPVALRLSSSCFNSFRWFRCCIVRSEKIFMSSNFEFYERSYDLHYLFGWARFSCFKFTEILFGSGQLGSIVLVILRTSFSSWTCLFVGDLNSDSGMPTITMLLARAFPSCISLNT